MTDTVNQTLDVRELIPMMRHTKIFQLFDDMQVGEAFILINDHDPKPLYYQFVHERPDQFSWDYLEEGPQDWHVRIGKVAAS